MADRKPMADRNSMLCAHGHSLERFPGHQGWDFDGTRYPRLLRCQTCDECYGLRNDGTMHLAFLLTDSWSIADRDPA
jgi:hypothetical protein